MGLNKKGSVDKYFEKDPFLAPIPLTNNNINSGPSLVQSCCEEKQKIKCSGILLPTTSSLLSSLQTVSSASISLCLGISLIVLGFICFIVSPQIETALTHLIQSWTALSGGPMLAAWLSPPIVPLLHVYLFNITNPEDVIRGLDPITQEIGPYVYSSTHIKRVIENDDKLGTLQFRQKNLYKFQRDLSVGAESDSLTMLNMVMITAFNKVRSQPGFVKSSVVLPLLRSIGNPEPIVSVTVGGFLFGYEDDLACIGQIDESLSDDDDDDDSSDDDWDVWEDDDFFFRRKRRSVPNYRDPESGKCLWGVLKDLNNTEHESVRIMTGQTGFRSKGEILDLDGRTSFGAWRPECDSFRGSTEPSALPADLQSNFSILVPVMCRTLSMVKISDHEISDIPVTRYQAHPDSLSRDQCYCPHGEESCLPSGYLNLESCYPDISPPLAVSFPHGLHSPSNPLLTHPPSPDPDKHNIFFDINNQLGVPLAAQVSFQLSAMLRPDTSFPLLDSINSTRLVPLFWASEGFSQPNSWMISHTKMALEMPVVASLGCAGGLLGLGLCFLVIWLWKRNH